MDTALDAQSPAVGPAGSPIPFDLYREVHKGLRLALFDLITDLGATDCRDDAGREAAAAHVQRVIALLHAHHHHEDTFIQPLIETHAPRLAAMIEAGHMETEADLVEIEVRTDALVSATGDDAVLAGHELYQFLALFVARYLAHMALEQGAVMEELRAAVGVEALFQVEIALRGSISPPLMCDFIAVMAPSMNVDEVTGMLGGMKAGAPPEIFEIFRAATEAALDAARYAAVAGRIGVA
ncbi:MAG: hypothetical protein JWL73_1529 [Actinomycetia bacterium]|nr:hypothetical protein [Actinomycetes bacterium]